MKHFSRGRSIALSLTATVALALFGTGTAHASGYTPDPVYVGSASGTDFPCWTSFSDDHPDGSSFDQIYVNCGSGLERVCPQWHSADYSRKYTWGASDGDDITLSPGEMVDWHYDHSNTWGYYTTVFC